MANPTYNFEPTIEQLATMVLLDIGAIQQGDTPAARLVQDIFNRAQMKLTEWQALQMHVWTEEEAIMFLQSGQYRYLLGGTTPWHCVPAFAWTLMQIATAQNAGSTSLPVVSVVGVVVGDTIGVGQDDGSTFWTTVASINAGTNTITLAAPLTMSAAAGNFVFDYPVGSEIVKPLGVPAARSYNYQAASSLTGNIEVPIFRDSRQEYMDRPNKGGQVGVNQQPIEFFYAPRQNWGEMFVYTCPQGWNYGLRFTWFRPLISLLDTTTIADFPAEWFNALHWNLSKETMIGHDVPPPRAQMINAMAEQSLKMVAVWDTETEDIQLQMDMRSGGGVR